VNPRPPRARENQTLYQTAWCSARFQPFPSTRPAFFFVERCDAAEVARTPPFAPGRVQHGV